MPEHVLHILGTAQPEGTGIARIVSALARSLDPARYKVHACFLSGDGPLIAELRSAGANAWSVDWPGGARHPAGAWQFWRSLLGKEFRIIHQHFGGRAPRWLARSTCRAKVVTHLHGNFLESGRLVTTAISAPGADLVIAVSQAVADCVIGAPARVVHAGVDTSNMVERTFVSRSGGRELVVGTIGRLVPIKGIVYLVRAFALLRDVPGVRLEILGSGPELPALEHEVHARNLAARVKFLGWQTDIAPFLASWDVYVQPSVLDTFPIATIEATAAGLPVVATTVGGFPELVEEGQTGWLVPPCDPVALADQLRRLLLDKDLRNRMGTAGRRRAQEHFSVDRMVRAISNIYDEVLSDS